MIRVTHTALVGYMLMVVCTTHVFAQSSQQAGSAVAGVLLAEGAVVSATRNTLVIRETDGAFKLFVLDEDTTRPASIPQRASVTVQARPGEADSAPVASVVKVTAMPAPAAAPTPDQGARPAQVPDDPVPTSIRRTERDIERQARRYRLGVRAGGGLDPELITIGFHGQVGPFFNSNFFARPNLEFAFGEVTDLIGLNFEGIYRVPVTNRLSRWSFFMGAGPSVNFTKRGFTNEDMDDPEDVVDFDEFHMDLGLNVLAGVQSRDGIIVELKATAYGVPHMRFIIGYNF
jgi:hypothetical protein